MLNTVKFWKLRENIKGRSFEENKFSLVLVVQGVVGIKSDHNVEIIVVGFCLWIT